MINILHIINSFDKGGAEMMLFKFLKGTDKKKFTNMVICLRSSRGGTCKFLQMSEHRKALQNQAADINQ